MKQKVVIKVSMEGHKSRSKALRIVVGVSGVESAGLKGEDKSQIEVAGDGMDPVALVTLLRKKVGYAELVSVGPAVAEKKVEKKVETPVQVWPYQYHGGGFRYAYYDNYHVIAAADHRQDPCSIM